MAERSYPFDDGPGSTINEDQWSYMAGTWQEDGVDAPGPWDTALKLTSAGEALILHIDAGHANISGIHYHLDAPKTITFASNATSNPRIDRVVLKLDRATNTVAFVYKQGTPATSPIAPTIDRTWASPEINIGTFIVRGSSSTVLPAECFDQRDYVGRYVKVTEDVAGSPEGTIAYQPSVGKFYAKGASTIEIGAVPAPPNLAPYLLITSAASTYATQSSLSNYLTTSTAANTYVRQDNPYSVMRLTASSSSVSNGGTGFVSWDDAPVNTGSGWTSGNRTRFTAPSTGWYDISGWLGGFGGTPNGNGGVTLFVRIGTQLGSLQRPGPFLANVNENGAVGLAYNAHLRITSGDYIQLEYTNNSGGAISWYSGSMMAVRKVSND